MAKDYAEAFHGIRPVKDAIEVHVGEIPLQRAISIFSRRWFTSGIKKQLRDRAQTPKRSDRRRLKAARSAERLRRSVRRKG